MRESYIEEITADIRYLSEKDLRFINKLVKLRKNK